MATFEELSMPVRLFLKAYPWRHIHPTPWAQASQPLNQSRIAVVQVQDSSGKDRTLSTIMLRGGIQASDGLNRRPPQRI